jgi:hypothetical protein
VLDNIPSKGNTSTISTLRRRSPKDLRRYYPYFLFRLKKKSYKKQILFSRNAIYSRRNTPSISPIIRRNKKYVGRYQSCDFFSSIVCLRAEVYFVQEKCFIDSSHRKKQLKTHRQI